LSEKLSMLKVKGQDIVNQEGKKVYLRGINLGAWLMMEGYFLHGRNFGEHIFKREFVKHNGKRALKEFTREYRNNFIKYQDIKNIKRLGANCVRLPFNHRLVSVEKNFKYLDEAINWCKRQNIYCILDLHAAPGAQNIDWHSDSDGRALFWRDKKYRRKYWAIWRKVASRYKDEPTIAGYDLINEPVPNNPKLLPRLYARTIKEIRKIDKHHILFLEAHDYAQNLEVLGKPRDKNIVYSIHVYQPINFTFNFQPQLKYPGTIDGRRWDKSKVYNYILPYYKLAQKWNVPIFVGEFGIHYRAPKCYGELQYLRDVLDCFKKFGFHWTYWSYKAIANVFYPDGIWQYLPNSPWVRREGPVLGWENFYSLWGKYKKQIISSWRTDKFTENKYISRLLMRYF